MSPNEHAYDGASTPEATPRLCAAGAGGETTAKTCVCAVCAAKLRPSLKLIEGKSSQGAPCLCADEAVNIHSALLLICRVTFSCCGSAASPQVAVWASRSRSCESSDNGAPTQEATPRLYAAGAVGATTAKTCVCATELRPCHQLFEGTSPQGTGTSPRGPPFHCALQYILW